MPEIRTFMRPDRDQLAELVNVHIAAVVPGWALPVSALLAQFEGEPAQYVVDPSVIDRTTLVAVERDRVVAGAHLKRYPGDSRVSPDYYEAGEVAWLVGWPRKVEAAVALAHALRCGSDSPHSAGCATRLRSSEIIAERKTANVRILRALARTVVFVSGLLLGTTAFFNAVGFSSGGIVRAWALILMSLLFLVATSICWYYALYGNAGDRWTLAYVAGCFVSWVVLVAGSRII